MIPHIIDFLMDYFTHLNPKKIFGGILVLIGLGTLAMMGGSGDPGKAVWYAVFGILIGGVGFVVIYYDIAKDKTGHGYDELGTLTKAYEQKNLEERKISAWHMHHESDDTHTPDNK